MQLSAGVYPLFCPLREEEALVDVFVMEMLVANVNSLKMAHRDDKSLGQQITVHSL